MRDVFITYSYLDLLDELITNTDTLKCVIFIHGFLILEYASGD